jgi:hypothetical protein
MSVVATDEDLINRNLKEQARAYYDSLIEQFKRCDANDVAKLNYLHGGLDICCVLAGFAKESEIKILRKLIIEKEEKKSEKKLPPKVFEEPKSVKKKKK